MLGQTGVRRVRRGPGLRASMEGRAIARPNFLLDVEEWAAAWSFNGGPSNCSAKRRWGGRCLRCAGSGFNGGPSNCSAKPRRRSWRPARSVLQWRAEQLLGQTIRRRRQRDVQDLASMEGRAIARPNKASPESPYAAVKGFNGGPSNCSAKPAATGSPTTARTSFNGGPSNCSAKRHTDAGGAAEGCGASMEGRAIARPNGGRPSSARTSSTSLQWRAEQLLGQTTLPMTIGVGALLASMEGRAIARPNATRRHTTRRPHRLQWRAEQLLGQTGPVVVDGHRQRLASMEGRAIARPNRPRGVRVGDRHPASMEGRAIARPNRPRGVRVGDRHPASMEGRAIARPNRPRGVRVGDRHPASMEGRAIARPNSPRCAHLINELGASMEGRAIARPNPAPATPSRSASARFNGGPSNCSAKLGRVERPGGAVCPRFNGGPSNCSAKPPRSGRPSASASSFNGGPSNCSAKRDGAGDTGHRAHSASMEGRAIARPNAMSRDLSPLGPRLQWRAEQLLGQTATAIDVATTLRRLQWRAEQLLGQTCPAVCGCDCDREASMEGRAIARPNPWIGCAAVSPGCELQWRAEQLLGQTCTLGG